MIRKAGTDPEFLLEKEGVGILSSIGLVGGTKDNPRMLKTCSVHEDNVTMELNIPPAEDEDGFVESILNSIKEAEMDIGIKTSLKSSHRFDKESLSSPQAMEFGCETDIDAWTMDVNPPPMADLDLRTCGGHFHLDLDENEDPRSIVLALDIFLGLPSVLVDPDRIRRRMYGKASSFRHTSYGIEYRALSNFWCRDERLIRWVWKNAQLALESMDKILDDVSDEDFEEIRDAINFYDEKVAKRYIEEYKIPMP